MRATKGNRAGRDENDFATTTRSLIVAITTTLVPFEVLRDWVQKKDTDRNALKVIKGEHTCVQLS